MNEDVSPTKNCDLEETCGQSGWETRQSKMKALTLPETNIAPENGWLEYDPFLLGRPIFRGELFVSGRVFLGGLLGPGAGWLTLAMMTHQRCSSAPLKSPPRRPAARHEDRQVQLS